MFDDEEHEESFEETLRSIARELGHTVEHMVSQVDLDEIAASFGVDAERAQEWLDSAGSWLRAQAETFGDELASRAAGAKGSTPEPGHSAPTDDPLRSAAPHPLDLPTEEQGLALAALESGRWTVEPGTDALSSRGEGPGPSEALGLAGELRARDWIAADGLLTLAGRHALSRWLDAAGHAGERQSSRS
jgi:hypothetical protein